MDHPKPPLKGFVAALLVSATLAPSVFAIETRGRLRFDRDIRPILSDKCFHCHGPDPAHRQAKLRLDLEDAAKAEAIKPGRPNESPLVAHITSTDPDVRMPPPDSNKTLSADEITKLSRWIAEGAEWSRHWAFISPQRPPPPRLQNQEWARNAIDDFVLAKLEKEGLAPAPEASRETHIRRLSFDLTGLPPTLAEIDEFRSDTKPGAYERLVDRLLDSRHYGERMAVLWLDAARYGDTSVFHADGFRDMWAWRDRVVESFNEGLPFDAFSTEQLAGDLLPDASVAQRIAAGFNRNNGTTDEGGLIPEEYRVEYAVDRVKTTSMVWLGLTMECAQCHEHKYDPIPQEEYYQFFAFFNRSADTGSQSRSHNSPPLVNILSPENEAKLPALREKLAAAKEQVDTYLAGVPDGYAAWVRPFESGLQAGSAPKEDAASESDPRATRGSVLHATFDSKEGDLEAETTTAGTTRVVGKLEGEAERVDGRTLGAVKLGGKAHIAFDDVGNFARTDSFSYGGWFLHEGAGALLSRMDEEKAFRGYDLLIDGAGKVSVHIVHEWPKNAIKVTTQKAAERGAWRHILATYDGSSKGTGVAIYIDGELSEVTVETDGLTDSIRTAQPFRVGIRTTNNALRGVVDEIRVFDRALTHDEVRAVMTQDAVRPALSRPSAERDEAATKILRDYYIHYRDARYVALQVARKELEGQEQTLLKPATTVMIMGDMKKPRDTFVLLRGAYDAPTETKVEPGTPSMLPSMPADAPRNRLGLARWLFAPEHPLTARVAVNQYWQMLFGIGLVATAGDFGSQGDFPSHPDLLDWLAVEFRETGWDIKRLLKLIVTSATYRQTAEVAPELYARDPQNRLLARGPRFRLQAEFLRDNALAVSGLLVKRFGGPGVKPYQPPGLWKEVGLGGKPLFAQDQGAKLYRRSIYTYWKRSAPPPTMQIFDAPTREKCTIHRARTNTPLQALVILNDVQYVEAARGLAQRMLRHTMDQGALAADEALREQLAFGFRLVTARQPTASEFDVLGAVHKEATDEYRAHPEAAEKLLATGESPRDEAIDAITHAAMTAVGSLLLNLDETLTRG
jgi:hypothetical protein